MTTRPEGIRGIGYGFGCGAVSAQNVAKALVSASGRNCTAIGVGNRHIPMWMEWYLSVSLGVTINDLKNCRSKVEGISNLVPAGGSTRLYKFENRLLRKFCSSFGEQTLFRDLPNSETASDLFDHFRSLVFSIALDWDGPFHHSLRRGFHFTLSTGDDLWAEISRFVSTDTEGREAWSSITYRPASSQGRLAIARFSEPVSRQAIITLKHLEVLALLWTDSIRQSDPGTDLTAPRIDDIPELAAEVREGTTNENAGSPGREPASLRNQDRGTTTTIQRLDGLDNEGECENTQPLSCRGSVRSANMTRRIRHERVEKHRDGYQHATV